jgi:hypothetical protein
MATVKKDNGSLALAFPVPVKQLRPVERSEGMLRRDTPFHFHNFRP